MTPLHVASRVGPNQRQTVRRAKCVYRLTKLPEVDLDRQNKEADTALHIAAATGNELAAAILLKKGADPGIDNHIPMEQTMTQVTTLSRSSSMYRRQLIRRVPVVPRVRVIAFSGTPDVTAKMAGHITLSNLIGESRALRVMLEDAIVPPLEMLCRLTIRNFMTAQFKPISLLKSVSFPKMEKQIADFVSYQTLVICPNTTAKIHQALGCEISHFLHDQTRTSHAAHSPTTSPIKIITSLASPRANTFQSRSPFGSEIPILSRQLSLSTRAVVDALRESERRHPVSVSENDDDYQYRGLQPVHRYGSEPTLLSIGDDESV